MYYTGLAHYYYYYYYYVFVSYYQGVRSHTHYVHTETHTYTRTCRHTNIRQYTPHTRTPTHTCLTLTYLTPTGRCYFVVTYLVKPTAFVKMNTISERLIFSTNISSEDYFRLILNSNPRNVSVPSRMTC